MSSKPYREIWRLMLMKIIARWLILALTLAALSSCATYRPISSDRSLNGVPVTDLVVVLEKPYSFRPGYVMNTLPAGIYRPAFEDDNGVYFQCPTKVIIEDVVGSTVHDGGVYIKFTAEHEPYYYVGISRPANFRLPRDFQFKLERLSSQRNQ